MAEMAGIAWGDFNTAVDTFGTENNAGDVSNASNVCSVDNMNGIEADATLQTASSQIGSFTDRFVRYINNRCNNKESI